MVNFFSGMITGGEFCKYLSLYIRVGTNVSSITGRSWYLLIYSEISPRYYTFSSRKDWNLTIEEDLQWSDLLTRIRGRL